MTRGKPPKAFRAELVPPAQRSLIPQSDYVLAQLSPGSKVTRIGRTWRVGQTSRDGAMLLGRIGVIGGRDSIEVWEEDAQDFNELSIASGVTTPFAVNLETLELALCPRPPRIKLNGLRYAIADLLTAGGEQWRVEIPEQFLTFDSWVDSVVAVTDISFHLLEPNPRWEGAEDIKKLMEGARAGRAIVDLESQQGLNTDSSFIRQARHHIQRGYGYLKAHGWRRTDDGEPDATAFDSRRDGRELVALPLETPEGEEVTAQQLARVLNGDDTNSRG